MEKTNSTNNGWVKLYRKLNDTSFKTKPLVVALFVHLLTSVNHQKKTIIFNDRPLTIEAGELVTGRKELSKQTGISQQSIRSALVTLKSTNTITIKTTNKFSVITICNWKDYQESTNKLTNKQPTSNQQATTNNNDKNEKNDKTTYMVEKITLWAYKRARVTPSCTADAFRRSVLTAIDRVGEEKVKRVFEKEENAIRFLSTIKGL